jgi:hypothetical protein
METLTSVYQDSQFGGLIPLLFLLGTLSCVRSTHNPAVTLLPMVVLSQLLLYVALDAPSARYRYPLQPLITLLASVGFIFLAARGTLFVKLGTAASVRSRRLASRLCLGAGLMFSLLFAARGMASAFGPGDVVQDDFRQWIVWLARLRDPNLFQGDLIADYYRALAPPGYTAVFWVFTRVVDPLLASKLLPPLLGLVAALFTFLLVQHLHSSLAGAFLATLLSSWYFWQYDDLASATPRAFALPLLTILLWSLVAGRRWITVVVVGLAALLYPVIGVVGALLLGIRLLELRWPVTVTSERSAWVACLLSGLLLAALVAPSQLATAPFGPVVSAEQAHTMPEFGPSGRIPSFFPDVYTLLGSHEAGFDLRASDALLHVPLLVEYLVLALLLLLVPFKLGFDGVQKLSHQFALLVQVLVASFGLFFLAHLLFFHLYHPSRYVKWSVPLVLAIVVGLSLGMLLEALVARIRSHRRDLVRAGLAVCLGLMLVYPVPQSGGFKPDPQPAITAYLQSRPKDILIAGLLGGDSVPALAGRRILVSREHALPYHLRYYSETQRRTQDLIAAYYAQTPGELADFATRYGIDLFLVNRDAYRLETFVDSAPVDTLTGERKRNWEPFTTAIVDSLTSTRRFALLELADRCAVVDDGKVALVPTSCIHSAGHSTSRLQEAS